MGDQKKEAGAVTQTGGMFGFLRQNKIWWLLPLAVLLLLLGIICVLGHLSSADTEMYPTTQLRQNWTRQIS